MQTRKLRNFQKKILNFYIKNGRHALPWRQTHDPYKILVSEVMLQQTQVERVVPKYEAFLKLFPTVTALSKAPLASVLRAWNGLGYNRRARMLHTAAHVVAGEHNGVFPKSVEKLEKLAGVGPYTARAVAAFAYNTPVVMIETNIRSVFLHEFFSDAQERIEDTTLMEMIEETLVPNNARQWYAALMDYGTYLKKKYPNPSRKSKQHSVQAKFKGSLREVRGKIVPALFDSSRTAAYLVRTLGFEKERVELALEGLRKDGLVERKGRVWQLIT